jgi:tRNA-splicing ligase RtcB
MQIIDGIPVFGPVDPGALEQIKTCARTADKVALMGDHHLGYAVPIGGVVAYRESISPSGVGYDIACGNKAVLTDVPGSEARAKIKQIMDDIWHTISFGIDGRNPEMPGDEPLFMDPLWGEKPMKDLYGKAQLQLGTVGSGNHYVDVLVDEADRTWIGVHFGSRGFGHRVATHFLNKAGAKDGMMVEPCVISATSGMGEDYLRAMRLAGEYAHAGRDWVCARVARLLGAKILEEVHNHHNFAWREEHGGESYWVVRKGATPAWPGQKGFVGGSMGDISVILEGVESELSALTMHSTVHGAGRVLGRAMATGKKNKDGTWKREPLVRRSAMLEWIDNFGVELRGAGVDESPHCYKRLPEVLEEHTGTIKILEVLRPIGVAMAQDGRSED